MRPEIKDVIAIADHFVCRRLNFNGLLLTWLLTKNSPLLSSSTILLLDLAGRLFFIIDDLLQGGGNMFRRSGVGGELTRVAVDTVCLTSTGNPVKNLA